MYRKKNQILELTICIIDAFLLIGSLLLSGILRYGNLENWKAIEDVRLLLCVAIPLHVAIFYFLKIPEGIFRRGRYREAVVCLKYSIMMVICIASLGFAIKQDLLMSRLQMGYFFTITLITFWAAHILIRNREKILKTDGRRMDNLLIVTTKDRVDEVIERFQASKEVSWNIAGIILLDQENGKDEYHGIPVVGGKDNYFEFASTRVVDEVFIQVRSIQKNERLLQNMILEFEKMGLVVNLSLDLFNLGFSGEKRIYPLEGYNVVAFSSQMMDYRMVLLKRLMDIIGGLVGLAVAVILGILIAPFLLSESPGPLIFKQKRVGKNGRIFEIYKFRSMYLDAEERKQELLDQNEMSGPMFKMEDDPRVTKVGRFIRKTSIDEFPQFWNVLKGDMSLVGTRPPTLDEFQQYEAYQRRRMSFRPGITGLWQVSGRNEVKDFDEVVKLDLEYIDNWSIGLDIKILCKTLLVVLKMQGAE